MGAFLAENGDCYERRARIIQIFVDEWEDNLSVKQWSVECHLKFPAWMAMPHPLPFALFEKKVKTKQLQATRSPFFATNDGNEPTRRECPQDCQRHLWQVPILLGSQKFLPEQREEREGRKRREREIKRRDRISEGKNRDAE